MASKQSLPPQQDNNLAIASLVLGITSVMGASILTGIPAIITGIMALKNPANKGLAVAGIVMGGLSVLFLLLFVLFFIVLAVFGIWMFDNYEVPQRLQPDSASYFEQRI